VCQTTNVRIELVDVDVLVNGMQQNSGSAVTLSVICLPASPARRSSILGVIVALHDLIRAGKHPQSLRIFMGC
jgi:hypothetical protein